MAPTARLDRQSISGIMGSISIACWIVVFTPQLYENFKRQSAEGLSLTFIVLWLAGDVFNVIGSVVQGVLPTMIVLAIYYTLADIVLLFQYLFYHRKQTHVNAAHLSPATPLAYPIDEQEQSQDRYGAFDDNSADTSEIQEQETQSVYSTVWHNTSIVLVVIASGVLGWFLSSSPAVGEPHIPEKNQLEFSFWGQIFGYLCAILYLASRVPQIVLNFRRKSCEGISFLFFLFACLGNLTYFASIFASGVSRRYLLINASWLAGSIGTLFLDFIIFIQFWVYNLNENY